MAESLSILVFQQPWFVETLRSRGHRVVRVGWESTNPDVVTPGPGTTIEEILSILPRGFQPDRIVYLDDSSPLGYIGFEEVDIPMLYYSIDAHHHARWQKHLGAAFHRVFVAQKDFVSEYQAFCSETHWFPLWAPIEVEPSEERPLDVAFRGNLNPKLHPVRAKFFEELSTMVNVDSKTGPWPDAYRMAKIVVNQNVKNDVNFRNFEGATAGAMMLTPYCTNGLSDCFVLGEEIVTFEDGNVQDAAEKVRYYLEHEEERKAIAARGRERVLRDHSLQRRTEQLEQHLLEMNACERPFRYLGSAIAYYSAAITCRRIDEMFFRTVLRHTADTLVKGLRSGEDLTADFAGTIVRAQIMMQSFGYIDKALELGQAFFERAPRDELAGICYITTVLRHESPEKGRVLATQISSKPDEYVAQVGSLYDQISGSIRSEVEVSAQSAANQIS